MNVCSGFDSIVNECQTKYVISTDSYYLTLLHTNDTQQRKCTTSVYAYNWCYPNEKTLTIITVPTPYQSRCVHVSSIPKVKKKCSEECIEIVIQYPFHTHGTVATIHGHKTTKHTLPIVYIDNIRCLKLYTNVRITNYCFILVCCNFFLLMIAYLYTQIQIII